MVSIIPVCRRCRRFRSWRRLRRCHWQGRTDSSFVCHLLLGPPCWTRMGTTRSGDPTLKQREIQIADASPAESYLPGLFVSISAGYIIAGHPTVTSPISAKFKSIEQFGSRSSSALLFGFDGLPWCGSQPSKRLSLPFDICVFGNHASIKPNKSLYCSRNRAALSIWI